MKSFYIKLFGLLLFAFSTFGDSCLRSNKKPQEKCVHKCTDTLCDDSNKDCLCDGDCGYSCVKKSLKCSAFKKQKRGTVVSTGHGFNDTASFACDSGYILFGSNKRRCRAIGDWDGKITKCRKACKDPGKKRNSHRDQPKKDYFKAKKRLTYYCTPNYHTKDPKTITCLDSGKWSSEPPTCSVRRTVCGRLNLPQNTEVSLPRGWKNSDQHVLGSRVIVKCKRGFRSSGTYVRGLILCGSSGWARTKFQCIVKSCGNPRTPRDGTKRGSDYSIGEKVWYSCDHCYQLVGPHFRTCQANSKWSDSLPDCVKSRCSAPANIKNGDVRIFTRPFVCGSIVRYQCQNGYWLRGPMQRRCLGDGKWSGSDPKCEIVDCGDPGSPSNGKTSALKGFTYAQDITFTCNDGYILSGSRLATCEADGKWSRNLPQCLEKCSDPSLNTNADIDGNEFFHGKKVSFSCPQRYYRLVPYQSRTLTCNNGTWNHEIPVCKAPCNRPQRVKNGYSPLYYYTRHGDTVKFYCNHGYTRHGSSSIRCNDGNWSDHVPRCLALCRSISRISYGVVRFTYGLISGRGNVEDDILTFSCNTKYILEGEEKIKCLPNRRWNANKPQCRAPCGELSDPYNGRITTKRGFKHGDRVTFECDGDYVMEGDAELKCNDGRWSTRAPRCLAPCPMLDRQGSYKRYVLKRGFRHGETIQFACQDDYVIDGKATLRCNSGKWEGSAPSCGAPCQPLQKPIDGTITQNGYRHKETITFRCNRGYKLVGPRQRLCSHGGWSGNRETSCKAVDCGDPGYPENGKTTENSGWTFGQNVSFSCLDQNYVLVGNSMAKCEASGRWSSRPPRCLQSCPDPRKLTNARAQGSDFYHDKSVRFNCPSYHVLEPSWPSTIRCENGNWSHDIPKCKAPCDRLPTIENGRKNSNGKRHGSKVTFSCRRDYQLNGSSLLICNNGKWSDAVPRCVNSGKAPCDRLPTIANGRKNYNDIRHGSKVTFSCWQDYQLHGSSLLTCNNGKWSDAVPKCVKTGEAPCNRLPTIANGGKHPNGKRHGLKVTVSCWQDYQLHGSSSLTCNNGKWSDAVPKCVKTGEVACDELPIIQHGLKNSSDTRHGSHVSFSCSQGYRLNGTSSVVCDDGIWSGTVPNCVYSNTEKCPDPTKDTNAKTFENDFSDGKNVTFFCSERFHDLIPYESKQVTCNNGKWDKVIPSCKGTCDDPRKKTNAAVQGDVFYHGKNVTLSCGGNRYVLTCKDGHWDNSIPICGGPCQVKQQPKNGYLLYHQSGTSHGAVITFGCYSRYGLRGNAKLTCRDGLWDHDAPTCE